MTDAVTEDSTVGTSAAAAPVDAEPAPDPRRWLALGVVLTATFMVLIDVSIVNVAIPSIQNNLHASFAQVQFVIAGYSLAYAVFLITGGRLGDIHGRRRLFMLGMAGFTTASALCGLAQSPEMLVASRLLQGLMAALMYPQVLSVIQVSFPQRERGKAFGIFGSVIGMAAITGPLVGGLIIRDDVTGQAWRFVFLVNVPVGIASLVAAWYLLHETRAPHAAKLDLIGVAIVTAALFCLVFPLVQGRELGWPPWSFALIALSPLILIFFAFVERRIAAAGGSPLVRPSLFGNRAFTLGLMGSLIFFSGIPSFFFILSLTLQIGLHFSALHTGLTTFPFALGSAVASVTSVRLAPRLGKRILYVGCALLAVGMLAIAVVVNANGTALTGLELAAPLLVCGIGLGFVVAPILNIILAGIAGRDAGAASGVLTTVQQVGAAVGIAIVGVIFFGLLSSRGPQSAAAVLPQLHADLVAAQPGAPPAAINAQVQTFETCFVQRAQATDPSQVPSGCPQPSAGSTNPVEAAFAQAANQALGINFTAALERSVFYQVIVFALTGVLCTQLPGRRPGEAAAAVLVEAAA
ncbi:MAG TPA: MFS transporter [Candidatus Dormibacteraeota bacterium]